MDQLELDLLLRCLTNPRDRAMFLLMLRCGLRVGEVANLTLGAIDLRGQRLIIHDAKWGKARVVYMSDDATGGLIEYLKTRPLGLPRFGGQVRAFGHK